ncbi:hypothetical protein [Paucibacter sp. Y2R2-4]|uniref:hypothetical protein n=1 Tax=Paucibacter sp. Y2R2-4 TaxID=2893553 RepID=UPI0021E48843|nr:hypothetical protein [Paucibacter sp. Y2R2-4]MCV2348291.1 hypothetical protein [Paucibacter sp. Y2R2-4]
MGISLSTALSSICAVQVKLRAAAQNTASQGTGDCRRPQVETQTLETGDLTAQLRQLAANSNAAPKDMAAHKQGT